jgi:hypothetical protein
MKKLLLSAAVTAALFSGHASALIPTIVGPTSGTQQVNFSATTGVNLAANVQATAYFSGSSAANPFLEASIIQAAAPNTKIFKYYDSSKTAFTYFFSTSATPPTGLVASRNYVVHKRDKGGSVTAVLAASSLAANQASVTYNSILPTVVGSFGQVAPTVYPCTNPTLDPLKAVIANCTSATAVALAVKPATAVSVNLSDVDARQFASPLNGATAANQLATLALTIPSSPVATQVFGVAVNLKLRNAMQTAMIASGALPVTCAAGNETEACMPSFTTADLTALFSTGRLTSWANLRFGGAAGQTLTGANAANLPGNNDVHICSRAAGSGTLATAQIAFENAPCIGTVAEAIQMPAVLTRVSETGTSGSMKAVHATTGSGELENCLSTMDGYNQATSTFGATMVANGTFTPLPAFIGTANFRWAVGILNTDRNISNALPYRFVKIDGFSPSAANVAKGKYKFWSELTTVGVVPAAATNPLGFGLLTLMQAPATIAKSNVTNPAFGVTGYLGTADKATFDTAIAPGTLINAAFDSVRPVSPFTHALAANTVGSVNHCRAANVLGGAKALPGLN